ncbi:MAG: protein serine/threonine phosphatase [Solirubrobacterales bacterium]|jgi:serine phosphatase RsbU (regulator of sigma subunit)|nr:protein serine/threonine phosphatase [Solirubrobacterales bacterium]
MSEAGEADLGAGTTLPRDVGAREDAGASPPAATAAPGVSGRWRPSGAAVLALAIGLLITAALAVTSLELYRHNERRLLNLRVRELGLVISGASSTVQTPLASAAALADATNGSTAKFKTFIKPYVGQGKQFTSVSLWALGGASRGPLAVAGAAPSAAGRAAVERGSGTPGKLTIVNMLVSPHPSLGFQYSVGGSGRRFAVFAQNPLPANRRSALERNSAFADLDYLLYLGRSKRARDLLLTSVPTLPVHGLQASDVVPFGASAFTLVVTPREPLGGGFFHFLPWLTAIVGLVISLAAALMTDRLAKRRRRAELLAAQLDKLAGENRELYIEQRGIAHTLQQALLPSTLPELPGLHVDAQYVPAQSGGDIGGDWYDVVAVGERQALLVIGDVSGHGVDAATTMALLRHATLAYIAQDHRPGVILGRLSDFVGSIAHDYFATVLCALIDIDSHRLTIASAGHLPPLLLDGEGGEYVQISAEPPIGFPHDSVFREATVTVPPGATLVAFTDGLVERRGEVLDEGLARLRKMASAEQLDDDLLARLARELTSDDHRDDTALVSIQWQS